MHAQCVVGLFGGGAGRGRERECVCVCVCVCVCDEMCVAIEGEKREKRRKGCERRLPNVRRGSCARIFFETVEGACGVCSCTWWGRNSTGCVLFFCFQKERKKTKKLKRGIKKNCKKKQKDGESDEE